MGRIRSEHELQLDREEELAFLRWRLYSLKPDSLAESYLRNKELIMAGAAAEGHLSDEEDECLRIMMMPDAERAATIMMSTVMAERTRMVEVMSRAYRSDLLTLQQLQTHLRKMLHDDEQMCLPEYLLDYVRGLVGEYLDMK